MDEEVEKAIEIDESNIEKMAVGSSGIPEGNFNILF